ncbi:hypothetical protein F2P81_019313 [Scophthalmus maximus]|uniref:Uncharacterized protein n=1 Tax=Scophthalmus maximus TaxID=52904 RepID=A0A6A4RZB6_SCOMX|nr:hypothetical protein F2P81_019313 [Scophthalmus maximus]
MSCSRTVNVWSHLTESRVKPLPGRTEVKSHAARGSVTALLHNSSCPELKHKLRSCMPDIANVLRTLHNLTCKLKNFQPSQTDGLATSVLNSLRCPCPQRSHVLGVECMLTLRITFQATQEQAIKPTGKERSKAVQPPTADSTRMTP